MIGHRNSAQFAGLPDAVVCTLVRCRSTAEQVTDVGFAQVRLERYPLRSVFLARERPGGRVAIA